MSRHLTFPPLRHEVCEYEESPYAPPRLAMKRVLGLMLRVLVVLVGLYVIGCYAGATARPWCD